ncbi:MAG: YncE family protein [Nitrospirae bacterium]|nr:YncE family protein [Nitrospirota bacterium]
MTMKTKSVRIILLVFYLLLPGSFTGCVTTEETEGMPGRLKTQLIIYLNGPEKASLDITFELLAVNIIADDGTSMEITNRPQSINAFTIEGRQLLLGEKILSEGKYKKLQLIVKEASLNKKGRVSQLALPPKGIETDIDVALGRNQSTTLFLNWNADASINDGYMFSPEFTVKSQIPELSSLLIYVTNENSNNVSVINRQSGEIAATVMVGKKPKGMAISKRGDRIKVYVANSASNSISVIDSTTHKIENEIPIRFGREPGEIAIASLSSEKELLFVANYGSNNVSVVDTATYQEVEKIDVGRGPVAIAVDPPVGDLAGTRFLSFDDINILESYRERFINVYVVNQDSNNVSVLRINTATGRSAEVITLSAEWRPVKVNIDYQRGKAYVANYASDKLSVIDILQIVKGNISNAVSSINNVGFSIIDVISDPAFDRIYLLKEVPGEIMIIRPFAEVFDSLKTVMPPVMGTIPVGSSPRSFILDPEGRKLYVVNRGSDNISIIDKTTKREEEVVPVGRSPYGIAVFPK